MTTALVVFLAALPEVLAPGQTIERPVEAGAPLTLSLTLGEASVLPVIVRQDGIDVVVTVVPPGGWPKREIDVASDAQSGDEPASIGPGIGQYLLEIRAAETAEAPGRVRVEAGSPRPATPRELDRLRAEQALAEATAAAKAVRTAEGMAAILARLDEAASLWHALGDRHWAAIADLLAGATQAGQDPAGALVRAGSAASTLRALGRRAELARALQVVALAHSNRGEYAAALQPDLEALAIYRELGDRRAQAQALDSLGGTYLEMGETRRSLEVREEALELARATGSLERESAVLANLGATHWFRGEIERAYDLFVLAGKALGEQGNMLGAAATRHNIALCQLTLGDAAAAEASMREALPLCRNAAHRPCEAYVLQGLGLALDYLGRSDASLGYYDEALAMRRSFGDRDGEAWVLVTSALTRYRRNELPKAAELAREALSIYREIGGGWKLGLLLDLMGQIESRSGDSAAAFARHREALEVRRSVEDRQGQAVSLLRIARLERESGDLQAARRDDAESIRLMEDMRGRMLSADRRMAFMIGASLWPSLRDAYEDEIETLAALDAQDPGQGFAARAFEASERARARVLGELLAERAPAPASRQSPGAEDVPGLEDRLEAKLDQQVRLLSKDPSPELRRKLALEVEALSSELEQARARVRAASPREADLRRPEPLGLEAVQALLLDGDDTVLLEYFLGEGRSHAWVVGRTFCARHDLAPRSELEALARRVHGAVSAVPDSDASSQASLLAASRALLGPVASAIRGRRVIVVPDGALHLVPFAALPDPDEAGVPLIVRHEVVSLPSASALRLLRAEATGRPPAPRPLMVLADPVFDRKDERLARARGAPLGAVADPALTRTLRDVGVGGLTRLPFTRREARRILALAPSGSKAALDFDASLEAATDPGVGGYRYLHFATHGFLNGVRPELSGLVLSLVDRRGKDVRGFLSAREVLDLRLNAELVVLSGCSTGLGREMRGEGVVGLTRAFMHAGAERVVASLWEVDDAATEELMGRLYDGMLGAGKRRPAAALRAAQLALLASPRWRSPFYWAGFQIHGEWN